MVPFREQHTDVRHDDHTCVGRLMKSDTAVNTASPEQQNGIQSAEYEHLDTLRICRFLIILSEGDSKSFVVVR